MLANAITACCWAKEAPIQTRGPAPKDRGGQAEEEAARAGHEAGEAGSQEGRPQGSRGDALVMGWLLSRDVSGFNPARPAPMTDAKAAMIQAGRSAVDRFVEEYVPTFNISYKFDFTIFF